jgi:hypothetical protein
MDAARTLLLALREDDGVAVGSLDSDAISADSFSPAARRSFIGGSLQKLARAAPVVTTGVDLSAGLTAACTGIKERNEAPSKAVVVLSSGHHASQSTLDAVDCLEKAGAPVFAYSARGRSAVLQIVASSTGGEYKPFADVRNMYCEFRRIRALAGGDPPGRCSAYQLSPGDFLLLPFAIPQAQDEATLEIEWRGPGASGAADVRAAARIHGPSGEILKLPFDGIQVEETPGRTKFTIVRPLAGTWMLSVSGAGLPDGGVYVTFSGRTVPQAPPPPPPQPEETPEPSPSETPSDTPAPTPTRSSTTAATPTMTPEPTPQPEPTTPKPLETPPPND